MKKNLLLSLAITLLFSISALAQTASLTVTIDENIQEKAGIIEVPVYLVFEPGAAFDIGSFNLEISFNDPDVIIDNIDNMVAIPGFTTDEFLFDDNVDNNIISISWASDGSIFTPFIQSTGSLTDDILFTLQFEGKVGTSSFIFLDQNVDLTTAFYEGGTAGTDQIIAEFNNGSITISPAIPLSQWAFFISAGLIVLFMVLRAIRLF